METCKSQVSPDQRSPWVSTRCAHAQQVEHRAVDLVGERSVATCGGSHVSGGVRALAQDTARMLSCRWVECDTGRENRAVRRASHGDDDFSLGVSLQ